MNDPLTEINDRHSFLKLLNISVHQANEKKTKLALILIGINRFRRINRIYDCKTGDAVLKYLADKLMQVKRPQDFAGRISATTFGLCLVGIMNKGHAELAAHKVLRMLEIPLEFEDKRIKLDVSLGISLCPAHASITAGLIKKAEDAMLLAQEQGHRLVISEDYSIEEISEYWDIELGIEQAIINSEFQLHYQPKLCVKTGLPSGAEALIRWPHPSRGMIYPDQFIPIAEDHNHIKPMTIWILNVGLNECSQWTRKWGKMSLSINIPPDLMNDELVDLVENALNIWHPENVSLVLEILERSFALSNEDSFKTFEALQKIGAEISIDDFGTGYSALSYFKNIPARELKIDRSFIMNLASDQQNLAIVEFIIKLAHAFNMRIVAEGVEDSETLAILKKLGCDYIQGYVLAKAMPQAEFVHWLENYDLQQQPFAALYDNNMETVSESGVCAVTPASKQQTIDNLPTGGNAGIEDTMDILDESDPLHEEKDEVDLLSTIRFDNETVAEEQTMEGEKNILIDIDSLREQPSEPIENTQPGGLDVFNEEISETLEQLDIITPSSDTDSLTQPKPAGVADEANETKQKDEKQMDENSKNFNSDKTVSDSHIDFGDPLI